MSKPKFQRGRRIRSIDALIKQKFVWFQMPDGGHKIYHEGWVGSWQLHWVSGHLHRMYTVKEERCYGEKIPFRPKQDF